MYNLLVKNERGKKMTSEDLVARIAYANNILKIAEKLDKAKIPYEIKPLWEGYALTFPWCHGDVVSHDWIYGAQQGAVESMGMPWDEMDVTVLSAKDMGDKILAYYNLKKIIE